LSILGVEIMAGSIKWMLYTLDSGNTVPVKCDESNGEACGFDDYTGAAPTAGVIEGKALRKMRYITVYEQSDPDHKGTFWVGKPDSGLMQGVTQTVTIDGVVWVVSGSVGEKKTFPTAVDTGETDGDIT
jgi:hypothetical protein